MNTTKGSHGGEADLVRQAAAGDLEAFGDLYRRRRLDVHRFVYQMTGSAALADDLTQEVFLTLIDKISDFDPDRGSFPAYMYGIARKHLLRHFERWRPGMSIEHKEVAALAMPEILIDRNDPLRNISRDETVDAVRRAVLALPARYREAVVLCEFHEMSYEEAADTVGCAVGTIRSRLHRARSLLLKKLRAPAESAAGIQKPRRCLA